MANSYLKTNYQSSEEEEIKVDVPLDIEPRDKVQVAEVPVFSDISKISSVQESGVTESSILNSVSESIADSMLKGSSKGALRTKSAIVTSESKVMID